MKSFKTFIFLLFTTTTCLAQAQTDSTQHTRLLNHEIGFNTVSLIKQVISNNPTSVLPQLPYDLFYNLYYKDQIGLRLGVGYNGSHLETDVLGQVQPRTTDITNLNLRAGLSYNFVRSRRITFNAFADFIMENVSNKTANTSTVQSFPDPLETITVETSDKTTGKGAQVGVGVKYNFNKYLSVYAEIPFVFMHEETSSHTLVNDSGIIDQTTTSGTVSTTRIIIPTTVYLVLRF